MLGDDRRNQTDIYILPPYTQRCAQLELTTLTRRRINATVHFMYSIILRKFNSPHLKSLININTVVPRLRALPSINNNNTHENITRAPRTADIISIKRYVKVYTTFSSFNEAYRLFNMATFIDPSLPRFQFLTELLNLTDDVFGCYVTI